VNPGFPVVSFKKPRRQDAKDTKPSVLAGNFMIGIILAAGEGSRLRPLTLTRPKPMLPIAGRPMLQHIVDWLRHYGVTRIAINLHHCPDAIPAYFGDGSKFGVSLAYSREESILGTAGGVRKLADFLAETFVLVYGDVLTDMDLDAAMELHRSKGPGLRVTMILYHVPNPSECGIVRLDGQGRVLEFVEKPGKSNVFSDLANAGILVVEPEITKYIPPGVFCDFGKDVLPRLLAERVPIYGSVIPAGTYLLDIGSPAKYEHAQATWPTERARAYLREGRGWL
jgi:NDP-sugar pyrophosphorylase family protein